jgi:hypothetical protein
VTTKKPKSVEQRFPTAAARQSADEAIDELPESAPMTEYIDVWLAAYRGRGGIER